MVSESDGYGASTCLSYTSKSVRLTHGSGRCACHTHMVSESNGYDVNKQW
jgi:hypothetical protein